MIVWVIFCFNYKWKCPDHAVIVLFGKIGIWPHRECPTSLPKPEFVAEGLGCICRDKTAFWHLLWPVLLWFREIKLYPLEKELKSCCFGECDFNVLVQWVGLVVYNSESPEHLWIVREVHYSLSAVRHSSSPCKLQSSHQDAEHYLWPVTGRE